MASFFSFFFCFWRMLGFFYMIPLNMSTSFTIYTLAHRPTPHDHPGWLFALAHPLQCTIYYANPSTGGLELLVI